MTGKLETLVRSLVGGSGVVDAVVAAGDAGSSAESRLTSSESGERAASADCFGPGAVRGRRKLLNHDLEGGASKGDAGRDARCGLTWLASNVSFDAVATAGEASLLAASFMAALQFVCIFN